MSTFKLFVLSGVLSCCAYTALAGTFPRGCEVTGYGYSDNFLVVNEKGEQALYLVQNRSDSMIELERHEDQETFMSPPLKSKIAPTHWAAFASDVESLHFKCYTRDGANTAPVNCRDVLEVCQYPRVKFALSNMGNYWVAMNKPLAQIIQDTAAKGIYLRW